MQQLKEEVGLKLFELHQSVELNIAQLRCFGCLEAQCATQ